jgi:hypothetical protein
MKRTIVLLTLFLFFGIVANALSADFYVNYPFACKDRYSPGSQQLGFPEGDVLSVGCYIKPTGVPIKEVNFKNLDSALVLKATSARIGPVYSGLYRVDPMPPFDPSKHMGVWEIRVKDEKGNEVTAKTHKMDMKGQMPYLEGLKASGNPLAPTITWSAPNEKDIPKGAMVNYRVRLLKGLDNHFHQSRILMLPQYAIPEGIIKSKDLSEIYVRVECLGWDKNDHEHFLAIEFKSATFMSLKKALGEK